MTWFVNSWTVTSRYDEIPFAIAYDFAAYRMHRLSSDWGLTTVISQRKNLEGVAILQFLPNKTCHECLLIFHHEVLFGTKTLSEKKIGVSLR